MDSGEYLAMGARRENDYMNRPPKMLSNQDPRPETCFTRRSSEAGTTTERTSDSQVYAEIPDVRYESLFKQHRDAEPAVLCASLPALPVPRPSRSRCQKLPLSWCVFTVSLIVIIAILGAVLVTGTCCFVFLVCLLTNANISGIDYVFQF